MAGERLATTSAYSDAVHTERISSSDKDIAEPTEGVKHGME